MTILFCKKTNIIFEKLKQRTGSELFSNLILARRENKTRVWFS